MEEFKIMSSEFNETTPSEVLAGFISDAVYIICRFDLVYDVNDIVSIGESHRGSIINFSDKQQVYGYDVVGKIHKQCN